jgi:hypothetical protein
MGQQLQILTEPEIQVNREKYQSMVGKEVTKGSLLTAPFWFNNL